MRLRLTVCGIVKLLRKKTTRRTIRPSEPSEAMLPQSPIASTSSTNRSASKRRVIVFTLFTLLVLLVVAAFAGAAWALRPHLSEQSDTVLSNQARSQLVIDVDQGTNLNAEAIQVSIDGKAVESGVRVDKQSRVHITLPPLADGKYSVEVVAKSIGVLRQDAATKRSLIVDTTKPELSVSAPALEKNPSPYLPNGVIAITKQPFDVVAKTEDGAKLEITSTANDAPLVERKGSGKAALTLPEGSQWLVVRSFDAAGNKQVLTRRVIVDTKGPKLRAPIPRQLTNAALGITVEASDAHGVELELLVNGKKIESGVEREVLRAAPGDNNEERLPLAAKWAVNLEDGLYEGRQVIELIAKDSVGAVTKYRRVSILNSTESLAEANGLRVGAKGTDVTELQNELIRQSHTSKEKLGNEFTAKQFGAQTKAAVQAFQASQAVSSDGVAGTDTLAALTLKIVIDRATKKLTLYRSGQVVETFGVAVGSPEYETPPGTFKIQNMQQNPTWIPPDSDWAKDAKPIPPGPDNPLGTRWMGFNGTVGIHGTNNPASIGFSVSHGCVRMRIPDVERLFEMVRVGTTVTVV